MAMLSGCLMDVIGVERCGREVGDQEAREQRAILAQQIGFPDAEFSA